MSKTLSGRCMFIWKLAPVVKVELGIDGIVKKAKAAGLSSVWIKVADGPLPYMNLDSSASAAQFHAVRSALRDAGIGVWGWQVPYGKTLQQANAEANCAAKLAHDFDLDGILMDAEGGEGYFSGGPAIAEAYASALSSSLRSQGRGIAMCGNDIPSNFKDYPFETFVEHADVNAPQVYYGASVSVLNRLDRAMKANKQYGKPIIPVGAAWIGDSGGCSSASACAERAREFLRLVKENNLQACSFWHWMGAPAAFWEVLFETAGVREI